MNPSELKDRLTGVIAFCPTPFAASYELRTADLADQVDFLCGTSASAVVVCGAVGEFYALDEAEHRIVVETAMEAAAGRLPVIVGIGDATRGACVLAEHAARSGAAGVLVNPLHFVQPDPRGLREHYAAIGAASGLGTIVFTHQQAVYDPEALRELAEVETVVGVKDELGDVRMFVEAQAEIGRRFAWINGGGEALAAPYFGAGADAFTSGIINFAPEVTASVWAAGAEGRFDRLQALVDEYIRPITQLRAKPGYSTTVIKEAMNLRGRPGGSVRPPLVPLHPGERAYLSDLLDRFPPLGAGIASEPLPTI